MVALLPGPSTGAPVHPSLVPETCPASEFMSDQTTDLTTTEPDGTDEGEYVPKQVVADDLGGMAWI